MSVIQHPLGTTVTVSERRAEILRKRGYVDVPPEGTKPAKARVSRKAKAGPAPEAEGD